MKTRTLVIAALVAMMPYMLDAQIGGILKKGASKVIGSVGKAASKEANKEVDSLAQKQADKMVENAAENARENNQQREREEKPGQGLNLGGLFGGKVDLKYNEEYKYDSRMVMKMEIYDNKGVTKMDYHVYFSMSLPNGAMEMRNISDTEGETLPLASQMVVDGINKCFLMLTNIENMRMGIISPLPDETTPTAEVEQPGETGKPPVISKTGNTKIIAGIKCEEYIVKEADEKEYTRMWFTKENVFNIDNRIWTKANMPSAYGYKDFEGGMIMAFESYDEKGKLSAKSEVTEINKDFPYSVSTQGYSLRQMNFNQVQSQTQEKK